MDLVEIVRRQEAAGVWYGFLLPVSFVVFWISAVAETNRAPFDLPEAESELVAGYHTEYSGMRFAYFYMAEYAHMVLVSSLVVNLFFGGWLPPFPNVPALDFLGLVPGFVWYLVKIMFFLYLYVWIRATFPRYRFDSLIRLVWKWFIPLALANLLVVALVGVLR
jgi:NADH-quinone oxidoreductase subunit H